METTDAPQPLPHKWKCGRHGHGTYCTYCGKHDAREYCLNNHMTENDDEAWDAEASEFKCDRPECQETMCPVDAQARAVRDASANTMGLPF